VLFAPVLVREKRRNYLIFCVAKTFSLLIEKQDRLVCVSASWRRFTVRRGGRVRRFAGRVKQRDSKSASQRAGKARPLQLARIFAYVYEHSGFGEKLGKVREKKLCADKARRENALRRVRSGLREGEELDGKTGNKGTRE
jgi:hypothetical protein